jgi:predicted nucleotidyltransferase
MYKEGMDMGDIFNKKEVFEALESVGVIESNVLAIYLFGSHYWGYDTEDSDIDYYVLLKDSIEKKQEDMGKISFRYLSSLDETNEAIRKGSWARYFILNYASKQVYGSRIKFSSYKKKMFLEYMKSKEKDIALIGERPLKWGFLTLMMYIFFINYFVSNITTFNLKDYSECVALNNEEKRFVSKLYVTLFTHTEVSGEEKSRIVELVNKLKQFILEKKVLD